MRSKTIIISIFAVLIGLGDIFGSLYFIAGIRPIDLLNKIKPNNVLNSLLFNTNLSKAEVSEKSETDASVELMSDDLLKQKMIPMVNLRKIKVKVKSHEEYSNLTPKVVIKAPDLNNERIYWERDFDLVWVKSRSDNLYEFDISDFYQTGTFLLDVNFYDEKGVSIFSLLNQSVIFGRRPKITNAIIKTANNKDLILNVSFDQEEIGPDPIWEIYAVVCNKDQCGFAKKDMVNGWPKVLSLDRKIEDRNLTINLIIKAKELKGYVNSYNRR